MFGAPFIKAWQLCEALNGIGLGGVFFRPIQFQPTFHKFADELCEGAFIHVTDRSAFEPVLTVVAVLQEVRRLYGDRLQWRPPPYEYEWEKQPIDILAGNHWLRPAIEGLEPLDSIRKRFRAEVAAFAPQRQAALIY
jgi:uncharacterized protein YbbC (DUF1343 family)